MSEENKALVRRIFEECYNQGNLDVADELFSHDYTIQGPKREISGVEGVRQRAASLRATFPDLHFAVDDQIAEGDKVMTLLTFQGTKEGDRPGGATDNEQVTNTLVVIHRIADGKIVEALTINQS